MIKDIFLLHQWHFLFLFCCRGGKEIRFCDWWLVLWEKTEKKKHGSLSIRSRTADLLHREENRCLVQRFHNMKNQFWAVVRAGLWNKKVWADYDQLLRPIFYAFMDKKLIQIFFWKYIRVRTEKLHRIKVNKSQKNFGKYLLLGENQFFRTRNLSVNKWRSGPHICSLICALNSIDIIFQFFIVIFARQFSIEMMS